MTPSPSPLPIDVISDVVCPWCYIGKRRFERALAQSGRTDVAVAWRPFQLNPDMPAEGMTRDDYVRAKFGGGDRPRQIYQAIAESGREAGIEFQFSRIRRTPNTVLSHRLVHWSAKSQEGKDGSLPPRFGNTSHGLSKELYHGAASDATVDFGIIERTLMVKRRPCDRLAL